MRKTVLNISITANCIWHIFSVFKPKSRNLQRKSQAPFKLLAYDPWSSMHFTTWRKYFCFLSKRSRKCLDYLFHFKTIIFPSIAARQFHFCFQCMFKGNSRLAIMLLFWNMGVSRECHLLFIFYFRFFVI